MDAIYTTEAIKKLIEDDLASKGIGNPLQILLLGDNDPDLVISARVIFGGGKAYDKSDVGRAVDALTEAMGVFDDVEYDGSYFGERHIDLLHDHVRKAIGAGVVFDDTLVNMLTCENGARIEAACNGNKDLQIVVEVLDCVRGGCHYED